MLLAVDGYRYGDKAIDRRAEVAAIRAAAAERAHTSSGCRTSTSTPSTPTARRPGPTSSSCTGRAARVRAGAVRPSAVRAVLVGHHRPAEADRARARRHPARAPQGARRCRATSGPGDRFFWFTTTGWMMWNYLVSGIGVGAAIVLFDGNPAHPDLGDAVAPRRRAGAHVLRHLRAVPAALPQGGAACRATSPTCPGCARSARPARRCRPRGSAGSTRRSDDSLQLASVSGGTDVCSAFVGAAPHGAGVRGRDRLPLPRLRGRGVRRDRPARSSASSASWSSPRRCRRCRSASGATPTGRATARRTSTTSRASGGTATGSRSPSAAPASITGRSDATLNRGGVRLGTREFYSVVEALPEVADSLVVHLEDDEGGAGS